MNIDQMKEYWELTGTVYQCPDMVGRKILHKRLMTLKPKSIIEVGCGHGAMFPYYKKIPHVLGVDWSYSMIERAEQRIAQRGYTNIQVTKLDITVKKHFCTVKFDVAITRTCLMHIPPEHIEQACKNVASFSDNLLIFEYWEEYHKPLAEHNWLHDYGSLFKSLDYSLINAFERGGYPQVLFYFKRDV